MSPTRPSWMLRLRRVRRRRRPRRARFLPRRRRAWSRELGYQGRRCRLPYLWCGAVPAGGSGFGVGQHQAEHQALHRIGGGIGALESAEVLLEVLGGRDQPAIERNTMHGREREAHRQDSDCAGFPYHPTEKTMDGRGRLAASPNLFFRPAASTTYRDGRPPSDTIKKGEGETSRCHMPLYEYNCKGCGKK